MDFINLHRFKNFLDKWSKHKIDDYTLKLYLENLENHYSETGSECFELGSINSKDNLPHCYYFQVRYKDNKGMIEMIIVL